MLRVKVTTYGKVNLAAGWHTRDMEFNQPCVTIEDILKAANLNEGGNLHKLIVDNTGVKEEYTVLLNEITVRTPEDLKQRVKSGDQVLALGIIEPVGGG